jgi:hypothetical protein
MLSSRATQQTTEQEEIHANTKMIPIELGNTAATLRRKGQRKGAAKASHDPLPEQYLAT